MANKIVWTQGLIFIVQTEFVWFELMQFKTKNMEVSEAGPPPHSYSAADVGMGTRTDDDNDQIRKQNNSP